MFGFRRRREQEARERYAIELSEAPDHGTLLAKARDNAERARLCTKWAEQARQDWFAGQRETIQDIVLSDSYRYRQYSPRARAAIGKQIWLGTRVQADLAADEATFREWADHYRMQAE